LTPTRTTFRQRLGLLLTPIVHFHFLLQRGMTLGVRCAAIDAGNRVFLVKHTYVPGWYLPGGGVDAGESIEASLRREMVEEGHIEIGSGLELLGLYQNSEVNPRDHVAFYLTRDFVQTAPRLPDKEIAEAGFFPLEALPEDATKATRRRVDEILGRRKPDGFW
jgi:ADP-ribose pyrophosphatase YjhB (NUDIX family)